MNNQLQNFARAYLLEGLKQLPEGMQKKFKRMYSHNNLDADIDYIVDNMSADALDLAMQQVERSLAKQT